MKIKTSKVLFLYSTIIASSLSMEKTDSGPESRLLKQQHEKEEKKMEPTNFDTTGQIETKQESDLMEFYDESGQQIFIEKQVYREKILQAFYELRKVKEGLSFIETIRSQQDPNNKQDIQQIFLTELLNSYESMFKPI